MSDSLYGFKNVEQYGEALVTDQIEESVVSWLEWGMLSIGGFNTATRASQTAFGSLDPTVLKPVVDERYTTGQVWQGVRSDWVWETGVPYSIQPVPISGVYVSGSFYPVGTTGSHSYHISYPEGRVVFNNPLPTGAPVQVEHSSRHVQVRRASEPWFQTIAFNSFREDDAQWSEAPGSGGAWDVFAQNRVQLPAIVVEPVANVYLKPLEIGSMARIHQQPFLLHVLAETSWERNQLHDILVEQYDKRILGIDVNTSPAPLNSDGSLSTGAITYPQACQQHFWRQIRVEKVESSEQEQQGSRLFWASVRFTLEVDSP